MPSLRCGRGVGERQSFTAVAASLSWLLEHRPPDVVVPAQPAGDLCTCTSYSSAHSGDNSSSHEESDTGATAALLQQCVRDPPPSNVDLITRQNPPVPHPT
jgi:hypothetical protein